jgi:hypothetical protein
MNNSTEIRPNFKDGILLSYLKVGAYGNVQSINEKLSLGFGRRLLLKQFQI